MAIIIRPATNKINTIYLNGKSDSFGNIKLIYLIMAKKMPMGRLKGHKVPGCFDSCH
jgi:hypothetical protein